MPGEDPAKRPGVVSSLAPCNHTAVWSDQPTAQGSNKPTV